MSKETAVAHIAVADLETALNAMLSEVLHRTMKGWTCTIVTLTFERPVVVEVTAHHDPKNPRGHTHGA